MTVVRRLAAALLALTCAACTSTASIPAARNSTPGAGTAASAGPSTSASPGSGANTSSTAPASSAPSSKPRPTLPRGGRTVFPHYRLVGYSGVTGATTLGRLGTGPLDSRVSEIERRAKPYARGRTILPVLEVIATVVQPGPGRDGKYRVRMDDRDIQRYLTAARRHRALLLLNIQPGRSEFLPEVKAYQKWLRQPDVGVALDPEWAMDPGQTPGRAYGHTTGAELDGVARYLAALVTRYDLPEKVMVYHQVALSVVRHESGLHAHSGVVMVKSVDGLGPPDMKVTTYRVVTKRTPAFVHAGFKLFFTEDRRQHGRLMTPAEVMKLRPQPEYILYE